MSRNKQALSTSAILAGLTLAASGAGAITPVNECPKKFEPATVAVEAVISSNLSACPLLEEKSLRKLVDKYAFGTVFAYPGVPGSCVSGTVTGGTVTTSKGTVAVTGTTESAQRFFAEAGVINPTLGGLAVRGDSADSKPFLAGAAMTAVSLQGSGDFKLDLQLLLDDRFSVDLSTAPFVDTEDFNIVGAAGGDAVGRLTGTAVVYGDPSGPLLDVPFSVTGSICLK